MNKYLFIIITIFTISSNLDAQCKRGEQLRITNDVEIKVVDCREATRLIYNEGWYPYSIEYEQEDRCPQLSSSAAEYYRNRDWKQTIRVYSEITDLSCDEWNSVYAPPEEIYQYYSFAYTQLGRFDSAEYVLLDGLQKIPQNVQLRKQLAYAYKRQGKTDKEIIEYERLADIAPDDLSILNDLAKIYKDQGN